MSMLHHFDSSWMNKEKLTNCSDHFDTTVAQWMPHVDPDADRYAQNHDY